MSPLSLPDGTPPPAPLPAPPGCLWGAARSGKGWVGTAPPCPCPRCTVLQGEEREELGAFRVWRGQRPVSPPRGTSLQAGTRHPAAACSLQPELWEQTPRAVPCAMRPASSCQRSQSCIGAGGWEQGTELVRELPARLLQACPVAQLGNGWGTQREDGCSGQKSSPGSNRGIQWPQRCPAVVSSYENHFLPLRKLCSCTAARGRGRRQCLQTLLCSSPRRGAVSHLRPHVSAVGEGERVLSRVRTARSPYNAGG